METVSFEQGDIVLSIKGRDKDNFFLIVKNEGNFVWITDGKKRKTSALKKKNIKHIKSVKQAVLVDLALQINSGCCVGNKKIYSMLKSAIKNKQED